MPDVLDAQGLQIKTATEIRADLDTAFRATYGADINIDQNSPDGQIIGILTQGFTDLRELILQTYNSFDPDRAVGRQLDERVAINNLQRAGGTFTIIDITLVVTQTIDLQGLDASFNDINGVGYTVQDNAGTQFILIDSVTLTAGTHIVPFRAQRIGQVETTIGTITNPVTIVIGVTSINNASAPTSIGQNEETDSQLRIRRQRSVANASTGYLNGLYGVVASLDGVSGVALYENYTNVTDSNGIPPHAIWLIVEGGANSDIGNAMYERKSYGCDMKGTVEYDITTASGAIWTAKFDRPQAEDLYIRFQIQRTVTGHAFDQTIIKETMVDNLIYAIGEFAETSRVTLSALTGIATQGGGGVPINVEISDDGSTWVDYLETSGLDRKWTLDVSRITITIV